MNIKGCSAIAASLMAGSFAHGQVFFNDFPSGDSYNGGNGFAAYGSNPHFTSAFQFTSLQTGQVGQVTVGIDYAGGVNAFQFELFTDASGAPGSMIGNWAATNVTNNGTATTLSVTGGPTLTSGAIYWFAVAAGDSTTLGVWGQNLTNATSSRDLMNAPGGAWIPEGTATTGAFRIQAVPEPSSLAAAGLGVAALLRRRRANKGR